MKGDGILIGVACAAILVAGGITLWSDRTGAHAFRLLETDGRVVTDRSLRGHWTLLYFGYTSCPDLCPTSLANMVRARDALGVRAEQVRPVFVTIDPARDTPSQLAAYARAFSPALLPLTGSPAAIGDAERAFGVVVHRQADGDIRHSGRIYLLDPEDRLAAVLDEGASADTIARTLERLLS